MPILIFCFLVIKMFTGKSIFDRNYAPVKGTVFNQIIHLDHLYDYHTQVSKKQPTFRLLDFSQCLIFTADPRNIEHVLVKKFDTVHRKGKRHEYAVTDSWGEGILAVDGDRWRQQRKSMNSEFPSRAFRDFCFSLFKNKAAEMFMDVSWGQVINDFNEILLRITRESIFQTLFGFELNSVGSNEERAAFIKAFHRSNELLFNRLIDHLWPLKRSLHIGFEADLKKTLKVTNDFFNKAISIKKKSLEMDQDCNVKEDMFSRFLLGRENRATDKNVRDAVFNLMVAGTDATANTLCWFFYMLCKNPLAQEKVSQEIIDITCSKGNNENLDDFMANITDETLDKMHYLHAALTETARLYPALPMNGRIAHADDILPDGYKVRKGDEVCYTAYAISRMPNIWGEDAEDFRPERWLSMEFSNPNLLPY